MEWVILNPSSIHEVCGHLGYTSANGKYCIQKESCGDALDELLTKLISDGPSLRTRRSLGLSQVISKDLLPLLTTASTEHPKVLPKLIKLLSYLTSPIECLVSAEFVVTDEGQQVVYEVGSLLGAIKVEFTEFKATKAVIEYLKNVTNKVENLTPEECGGVTDGLLLLRNILHVPHKDANTQHQILWNLFAHSIDKILLNLMTCEQKNLWGIAIVQLIALIYKDQHVANLQKLLNLWMENSLSESSDISEDLDNESNTSRPDHSSSPTLTSDHTSDSSDSTNNNSTTDNTAIGNCSKSITSTTSVEVEMAPSNSTKGRTDNKSHQNNTKPHSSSNNGKDSWPVSSPVSNKVYTKAKCKDKAKNIFKEKMSDVDSGVSSSHFSSDKIPSKIEQGNEKVDDNSRPHGSSVLEIYDNRRQSTSSDDAHDVQQSNSNSIDTAVKQRSTKLTGHAIKLVPKVRIISAMSAHDKREMKRKKLQRRYKRTKSGNKALVHHNPTEEDISHVLREFTVDFLLKGYGSLVAVLQDQLSLNASLQMDKSHFLWLITYFLKFASQMELDLEHISPVLSPTILSYLTFEGVAMCENLTVCKDDLKPHLRRMHLVVTALREFVQAVEIYSNLPSCSREDKLQITMLQNLMLNVEELRHLLVLLIRYFKPGVQSKQYLQDLVITNHVFLLLLERVSTRTDYKGDFSMCEFIKEFSSPLIMQQYGHLLEDFKNNGEFVNDCVFTMMHHIAGDLGCPEALYQPSILKTFSSIWEVEFAIRDDWADLIEYVIQRFMKASDEEKKQIFKSGTSTSSASDDIGWSKEDFNNLYSYYTKCSTSSDPIAKILELYGESASEKTRESILNQLLHQRIIGYNQFLRFLASERVETGNHGLAIDGSSSSSSHATAGSSCCSDPPSSPLDDGYSNMDPYPFTKNGCIDVINETEEPAECIKIEADVNSNDVMNEDVKQHFNDSQQQTLQTNSPQSVKSTGGVVSSSPNVTESMDVAVGELIKQILGDNSQDLAWLQNQILDACYVKYNMEVKQRKEQGQETRDLVECNGKRRMEELKTEYVHIPPIPHHYSLLNQSIPIIPWTHWQEILLRSPLYLLLLHKLGFHLPCDSEKIFPRIPHFWTAEVLLSVAGKLGPLPPNEKLKFDPSKVLNLTDTNDNDLNEQNANKTNFNGILKIEANRIGCIATTNESTKFEMPTVGNSFMSPNTSYGLGSASHSVNWMTLVNKSKQLDHHSESADVCSMSSTSDDEEEEENMDESSCLKAVPLTCPLIEEVPMIS